MSRELGFWIGLYIYLQIDFCFYIDKVQEVLEFSPFNIFLPYAMSGIELLTFTWNSSRIYPILYDKAVYNYVL